MKIKNNKQRKIGVIGHFGGNENILDGQTIKTKILYNELRNLTKWSIFKVDTYYKKKSPIKLALNTFKCIHSCKDIVVLLSGNGMKVYFPLLYFYTKIFNLRVYHDVIGGNLDNYVCKIPRFKKYLNSFQVNWVETASMKKKLLELGVNNCEVLPNFKRLNIITEQVGKINVVNEPYKFCIFSRVMREKGIETAINAIELINKNVGRKICELDIFGRIDDEYKIEFNKIMKQVTNAIKYKGEVPYDKSVETIKDYYALLFPTFWVGEGFPGTIIDAFSAGLPVVATDWNCNGEIIDNMVNGILYPNDEIKDLKDAIEWMIAHKKEMMLMKENSIRTAKNYQPDKYIKKIIDKINN
ncbi:glycosyltransferase family 4 protein [Clostridium cadaveris]|uniref:glycosyltransferase family 4 protein n=1 Tax=Clostridium cadaveris TaxID=1529 RepID=UPI003993C716